MNPIQQNTVNLLLRLQEENVSQVDKLRLLQDSMDDVPALSFLADIRAALGDPEGKLMQDDLLALCRELKQSPEKLHQCEDRIAEWECLDAEAKHGASEVTRKLHEAEAVCAEIQSKLDQLFSALNFKLTAPFEMVLGDAKLLRPEMAKARSRVKEIEGNAMWDDLYLEGQPGFLLRVWQRMRAAEQQLAEARKDSERLAWFISHTEEVAGWLLLVGWLGVNDAQHARLKLLLEDLIPVIDEAIDAAQKGDA